MNKERGGEQTETGSSLESLTSLSAMQISSGCAIFGAWIRKYKHIIGLGERRRGDENRKCCTTMLGECDLILPISYDHAAHVSHANHADHALHDDQADNTC